MATTAFGGGPTTEQRRAFAALKDGSQVPGYRGYIPQIKYRVGQTYGNDTSDLSQELGLQRSTTVIGVMGPETETVSRPLPKATGDNKYTERMVPGYTGYMPRMTFKFGDTYKRNSDRCIDEFTATRDCYSAKIATLNQQTASQPRLTAISHDPAVRDHLNRYRDTHPTQPILMDDKRALYEAPIPGYQGFVPRIGPTEIGLGQRYKPRAQQGLNAFAGDQQRAFGSHSALPATQRSGVSVDRPPYDLISSQNFSRRIYPNGGMIPKYTGYVPQRRYVFGNTYGDTTRSLEVCRHDRSSFGEYLNTQTLPRPVVPC
ncbi:ciliary microtubule inner protein 2B-like [Babylonia areolata]|uniref:ciliary microtubule inner protein 2B-like n=1 Tax=Babylonia areolata TaxID=304850 RepID=UPI003FD1D9E5